MILNTSIINREFEFIEDANIVIEDGIIKDVAEGFERGGNDYRDYVCIPALINAHTHIGDSFAKESVFGLNVKDAVGPHGKKWDLYKSSTSQKRISAMRNSIEFMLNAGISTFADFREFGIEGIDELKRSIEGTKINAIILGRDIGKEHLDECSGFGVNIYNNVSKVGGKLLAIHAGEDRGEIRTALKNEPDIIVHATNATNRELEEIARKKITIVICPRSNMALNAGFPEVRKMLELGINVAIGTDNVMIVPPDMLSEMSFLSYCTGIQSEEIMKMATINASNAFGLNAGMIDKNRKADLIFIEKNALNLKENTDWISTIVRRCLPENVKKIMINGEFVIEK